MINDEKNQGIAVDLSLVSKSINKIISENADPDKIIVLALTELRNKGIKIPLNFTKLIKKYISASRMAKQSGLEGFIQTLSE
ncbi:MAG: hypothetical protein WCO33_01800 [bacterium]